MAYLEFNKFPDLIKYYTTIGNGTLLKRSTLQSKNVHYLMTNVPYPIVCLRQHTQPNPTHNEYTTIVVKISTLQFGQHPTLYMISWPLHEKT